MSTLSAPTRERDPSFRDVRGLEFIDTFRVLALFGIKDPAISEAIGLLLDAGAAVDPSERVQCAIDALQRWQEIRDEDAAIAAAIQPGTVVKKCATCGNRERAALAASTACGLCLQDRLGMFPPTHWIPVVRAESRGDKDAR